MKLHVHLGVHKTATTYLQGLLAKNAQGLNAAGVGVMPLSPFRAFFTRQFMKFPAGEYRLDDHVERFFAHGMPSNVRGMILSDENLIGICNGLISTGKSYHGAHRRLAHLKEILAGHRVAMYLSIRSYANFTSSAYCEAMRHTDQFVTFASFRERLDVEALRWPAIIERFADSLRPAEIKLWRFEDFRDNSGAVFRDIAFGVEPEQDADVKAERPSFSEPAVTVLEALSSRLGPKAAAELVNEISERLPKGSGKGQYPAFDPWSPEDHERLAALYDEDCAAIPSQYWVISPGGVATTKKRIAAVA
jgi:hypothetical protein